MSAYQVTATIRVEATPCGYRARVAMLDAEITTRACVSVEELLGHVAQLLEDRRAAREADPRAWVV